MASASLPRLRRYSLAQSITPLYGTAEDKEANAAITAECPRTIDLTGQTSIASLARLMAGAEFVGNDTGPVFLGARTNRPTLMVMGTECNPDMSAPTGKYADYLFEAELSELRHKKHGRNYRKYAKNSASNVKNDNGQCTKN